MSISPILFSAPAEIPYSPLPDFTDGKSLFAGISQVITGNNLEEWFAIDRAIESGEIDLSLMAKHNFYRVLVLACKMGHLDALTTLLAKFPERVNGGFGFSPIHACIEADEIDLLNFLLSFEGIDVTTPHHKLNMSAVEYAFIHGSPAAMSSFSSRGHLHLPKKRHFSSLIKACDIDRLSLLLNYFPELKTSENNWGKTLLHMAADLGSKMVTNLCLSHGIAQNSKDSEGKAAGDRANEAGHGDLALYLNQMGLVLRELR